LVFRIIGEIFSLLGDGITIGAIIVILFMFFPNKIELLKTYIYFALIIYLMGLVKLFYRHPRPFFTHKDVKAWGCN